MRIDHSERRLDSWLEGSLVVPAIWLAVRFVLGIEFLRSGWEKLGDAGWTASPRGAAVEGFLNGVLSKAAQGGAHPEVEHWFAQLTQHVLLPHSTFFAYLIPFGELLVGAALILGLFTRVAAAFGASMNLTYLFAGTTSINPQMLLLGTAIVLAGRRAGELGVDRWAVRLVRNEFGERAWERARVGVGVLATAFVLWLALLVGSTESWLISMVAAVAIALFVGWVAHGTSRSTAPPSNRGLAAPGSR
jgi:thiosulfate dehydrogenase [quinone] large subunit